MVLFCARNAAQELLEFFQRSRTLLHAACKDFSPLPLAILGISALQHYQHTALLAHTSLNTGLNDSLANRYLRGLSALSQLSRGQCTSPEDAGHCTINRPHVHEHD